MRQALDAALSAWGQTSPNPLVGAVVVSDDQSWTGWHHRAGEEHAEINALRAAGNNARRATLFVTLEPCSTEGRTPPCTDAIISAGISRVVIGTLDPNPLHEGEAVTILKAAGIEVTVGVEQDACMKLNEAFNCWIRYKRPFVLLKMAMTLDGKIATKDGCSQWITGPESRYQVQRLRQWADAILVGGETVRQDNPKLTVREPCEWPCQPLRLVASKSGDLGDTPAVLTDGGAETRVISCDSLQEWQQLLENLGKENITSLLVEGGGTLAGDLLHYGLVDKVAFFIAPKILAGASSRPVVGGPDPETLDEALKLEEIGVERIGEDTLITGYLTDVHRYS